MKSNLLLFCLLPILLSACSFMNEASLKTAHYVPITQKTKASDKIIVFVHGLTGDVDTTWEYSKDVSWPALIKNDPELKDYDVFCLSYYTPYFNRAQSLEEVVQRIEKQLIDKEIYNYNEIYFVTHSMGGIIIKKVLNDLHTPNGLVNLIKVKAVIYISTPAKGSDIASLASWISFNPQLKDLAPSDFNSYLQSIENQWFTLIHERNDRQDKFPRSFVIFESLPYMGKQIVDSIYASTECDEKPLSFVYDHSTIVKPKNQGVEPYPWTKKRILDTSKIAKQKEPKYNGGHDELTQKAHLSELITELDVSYTSLKDNINKYNYSHIEQLITEISNNYSHIEQLISAIRRIDPENGHALYYHDETKRINDTKHFTTGSCIKPPSEEFDLDSYHVFFYRYLANAVPLQKTNKVIESGVKVCHDTLDGYCLERIAWICHLLANDLYSEALMTSDQNIKLSKLKRALDLADEALKYIPPPEKIQGFDQCIPTIELKSKIKTYINNN